MFFFGRKKRRKDAKRGGSDNLSLPNTPGMRRTSNPYLDERSRHADNEMWDGPKHDRWDDGWSD